MKKIVVALFMVASLVSFSSYFTACGAKKDTTEKTTTTEKTASEKATTGEKMMGEKMMADAGNKGE